MQLGPPTQLNHASQLELRDCDPHAIVHGNISHLCYGDRFPLSREGIELWNFSHQSIWEQLHPGAMRHFQNEHHHPHLDIP
jgi:hypothetical protein